MKRASTIAIAPTAVAATPGRLGLNMEVQDHHERTNLWDWLADSGAEVAREFHPESRHWRSDEIAPEWLAIASHTAFERWRGQLLQDPAQRVGWHRYRFDQAIPWMGVPDGFIPKVAGLGIVPLYSLGYGTAFFPRPLIRDIAATAMPGDDGIDWGAAASAYEFFFAVIHHYVTGFGARWFTMINEPENQWDWFHKPAEFAGLGKDWWVRLSWGDGSPTPDLGLRWFRVLGVQYGVLARLARLALEDVRAMAGLAPGGLHLTGPTNVAWEPLWEHAACWLDACDVHHYHTDEHTFRTTFRAVAMRAAADGKPFAISEFNRLSGGIRIDEALWSHDNALALADGLMTVLELARPDEPGCLFACFYLLNYPSTHRNYKHLLYGDMNTVDWSGRDRPLRARGEEWYPTFDELQIRHATPAYHVFRAIARAAAGGPHRVLDVGMHNPSSAAPHDVYHRLRVQAVDQGGRIVLNLLNRSPKPALAVTIDLRLLGRPFACAVLRACGREHDDAVLAVLAVDGPLLTIDLPAQALCQLILEPRPLHRATALRLEEVTATPGTLARLGLFETTRLRALGTVDGAEIDLTTSAIRWTSSHPELVRVGQGGLVQRLRATARTVSITATLPDGPTITVSVPRA